MTTAAELDALIEELTVDAFNDEEQLSGFLSSALRKRSSAASTRRSPASRSR
jgi:hypothetical protein